ncbi:hypothetical protein TURU_012045 [Turdus rufiventris]|nr:hypothetical protein TURU_012045 [Turdus rufiventris]
MQDPLESWDRAEAAAPFCLLPTRRFPGDNHTQQQPVGSPARAPSVPSAPSIATHPQKISPHRDTSNYPRLLRALLILTLDTSNYPRLLQALLNLTLDTSNYPRLLQALLNLTLDTSNYPRLLQALLILTLDTSNYPKLL